MIELAFMQVYGVRVRERLGLLNDGRHDALLASYADDVRVSVSSGAVRRNGLPPFAGEGQAVLRELFRRLARDCCPLDLVDAFGLPRSRTILTQDRHGDRIVFSLEVNDEGLIRDVFVAPAGAASILRAPSWSTSGMPARRRTALPKPPPLRDVSPGISRDERCAGD